MQHGKVAIVTGGAKGIGYCTAMHLSQLGMHVILAGNKETEGIDAAKKIQERTQNNKVEFVYCDLSSMKSIRKFVQNFKTKNLKLHILVNNAGVMLVNEKKTQDGFEEHFGLNYLGHFLLTNLLMTFLKKSGTHDSNARVVTVSSATHYVGELNFEELQSSHCYSSHGAYAQSTLRHIWWDCTLIKPYWENIKREVTTILGEIPELNIEMALLHYTEGSIAQYKRSILRHLLNAAKASIPARWKHTQPPTIAEWLQRVEEIHTAEAQYAELLGRGRPTTMKDTPPPTQDFQAMINSTVTASVEKALLWVLPHPQQMGPQDSNPDRAQTSWEVFQG
ncbi:dehydrogenase reductase SDR family member on chromosome X [Pelobates cultripes]|nr:dehydrogenase reductase SDR family member on chromosome X [Pelobates cultripes]